MVATIVIAWILCGLMSYGGVIGFFERKFIDRAGIYRVDNRCIGLLVGLGGPIGLVFAFLATEHFRFGFKYW